jgi:hypothetical protein
LRSGHSDIDVLIALGENFMPLDAALLFRNVGPRLIELQAVHSNTDHHAVVQFGATSADPQRQRANRLSIDADNARCGANA